MKKKTCLLKISLFFLVICMVCVTFTSCASKTEKRWNSAEKLLDDSRRSMGYMTHLNGEFTSNVYENFSISGTFLYATSSEVYSYMRTQNFYDVYCYSPIAKSTSKVYSIPIIEDSFGFIMLNTDEYYCCFEQKVYSSIIEQGIDHPSSYNYNWYRCGISDDSRELYTTYKSTEQKNDRERQEMADSLRSSMISSRVGSEKILIEKSSLLSELNSMKVDNDKLTLNRVCGYNTETKTGIFVFDYRVSSNWGLFGAEHYSKKLCFAIDHSSGKAYFLGDYKDIVPSGKDDIEIIPIN